MATSNSGAADLSGQTAVVTGAAGGMGRKISAALSRAGADVVASDVDEAGLAETAAVVEANDREYTPIECDVSDEEAVKALAEAAIDEAGSVDVLVCAHGFAQSIGGDITDLTLEEWEDSIAVNLTGTFLVMETFYEHMASHDGGRMVCIGSLAGDTGRAGAPPSYAAAKGGVHALARTFAASGGPVDIRVNAIAPGPIRTPFNEGVKFPTEDWPISRMGQPEDIAETVLYLVSQQSNWVTGQVLHVNGGIYM